MRKVRKEIIESINRILEEGAIELKTELKDETILLNSGLDSLGFAILVAELEDTFGFDPFVLMDEPVYPTTLRDFVDIYERFYVEEA